MFNFFGGVAHTIIIDNLKSGVIKPDIYDPILNRSYAEVAEYYNTFIDTARISRPKDKPKVERDVQTIREEFRVMLAINENLTLEEANLKIKDFLINEYGIRKHGTTNQEPIKVFYEREKAALIELPRQEFEVCQWKQAKVHPDCFIQINKKSYSLPYEFIGKTVQVKVKLKTIEVYYQATIIKIHRIPKNNRQIDFEDFPENIQKAVNGSHPLYLQKEAEKLGGNNLRTLIKNILTPHAYINRRKAQSIIYIAGKHPKNIIEQAAASALLRKRNPHPDDFKKLIEEIYKNEESTKEGIIFSEETKSLTRDINYFINN
jgi:regulator of replication initiation timing